MSEFLDIPRVLLAISEATRVSSSDIMSDNKTPHVVRSRKLAYAVLSWAYHMSNVQIGAHMKRDPSTVHSALKKLPQDPEWNAAYTQVVNILNRRPNRFAQPVLVRRVVEMVTMQDHLVVRCDDGTMWMRFDRSEGVEWEQLKPPPGVRYA